VIVRDRRYEVRLLHILRCEKARTCTYWGCGDPALHAKLLILWWVIGPRKCLRIWAMTC
jgi:hypothetical protein